MQQLGNRIGQAAGTDVMEELDRVVGAHRHAAVDDLLAAALHFRVVALDTGKIQRLGRFARRHRRGRATAQPDQHRRATEHDHPVALAQRDLVHLDAVDRAQAAGQHDRLVVGAGDAVLGQLEAAEVAEQVRAAELVVERGAAERAVEHDFQRRGHARVERTRRLPRLRQGRNAQVRDAETGQAGLWLAATAGGTLVADLTAGTGGGTRERGDRGRVVVGLDLDLEGAGHHRFAAVAAIGRVRTETRRRVAFDHRSIVAVGTEGVLRGRLMGVLDHPEQGAVLFLAVDGPAGVEDLVAAVLRVRLGEHHQLHVARVTPQLAVTLAQVGDLVLGQGQAQAGVGRLKLCQRDALELATRRAAEQGAGAGDVRQQGLGHRVVQHLGHGRCLGRIGRPTGQLQAQAALDPVDRLAGTTDQLTGLARPRRKGAQTRHHDPADTAGGAGLHAGAGLQDAAKHRHIQSLRVSRVNKVQVPGAGDTQVSGDGLQAGFEPFAAERGKGSCALEDDHVRQTVLGNGPLL